LDAGFSSALVTLIAVSYSRFITEKQILPACSILCTNSNNIHSTDGRRLTKHRRGPWLTSGPKMTALAQIQRIMVGTNSHLPRWKLRRRCPICLPRFVHSNGLSTSEIFTAHIGTITHEIVNRILASMQWTGIGKGLWTLQFGGRRRR